MASVDDLAQAIARFEGFFSAGSVAARNNNPGNLRSWGSYPVVNGYVQFPTPEDGWNALRSQVQTNVDRGLSLYEFFAGAPGVYAGYAPAADSNQPASYASTVAGWLGISSDTPLADVLSDGGGGEAIESVAAALNVNPIWIDLAIGAGMAALVWLVISRLRA